MKRPVLLIGALSALILAGCNATSSYLFTVTDPSSTLPVEGASLELTPQGNREVEVSASSDNRGESTLVLQRDQRYYLVVTFDGTTDRYLLFIEAIPRWDAPTAESAPTSPELQFTAGVPSSRTSPAWSVRVRRLR